MNWDVGKDLFLDHLLYVGNLQGRVPREISNLLKRMLQKKPEDRFESVEHIKQEFQNIVGGDISVVCPHTFAKKSMYRIGKALDNHKKIHGFYKGIDRECIWKSLMPMLKFDDTVFFISSEEINWITTKKNKHLAVLNFTIYYLNQPKRMLKHTIGYMERGVL